MLERDTQRACLQYLAARGIFAWRQNTAGVYDPKKDSYRFPGLRGVADILGCLPDGRLLAVEVKTPTGKVSPHQQRFLERITESGGLGTCVRSVDELVADLKSAGY